MQQLLDHISKTASIYVMLIVIFSYHVLFDKDMPCSCEEQLADCWIYMILPVVIIVIFVLWTDESFQRALKYTCRFRSCHFCCVLFSHILRAAYIGSLWVTSVLIDGDWFVCCYNHLPEQQKQLPCKDETNYTAEDRGVIARLKNKSRVSFYLFVRGSTLFLLRPFCLSLCHPQCHGMWRKPLWFPLLEKHAEG